MEPDVPLIPAAGDATLEIMSVRLSLSDAGLGASEGDRRYAYSGLGFPFFGGVGVGDQERERPLRISPTVCPDSERFSPAPAAFFRLPPVFPGLGPSDPPPGASETLRPTSFAALIIRCMFLDLTRASSWFSSSCSLRASLSVHRLRASASASRSASRFSSSRRSSFHLVRLGWHAIFASSLMPTMVRFFKRW